MPANVRIKWNRAEFVAISNTVNDSLCAELGKKVAAAARDEKTPGLADYIHIPTDPRSGWRDWAHTRVVNSHPKAAQMEARRGVMARALGSA